jgi:hypothetical protein
MEEQVAAILRGDLLEQAFDRLRWSGGGHDAAVRGSDGGKYRNALP